MGSVSRWLATAPLEWDLRVERFESVELIAQSHNELLLHSPRSSPNENDESCGGQKQQADICTGTSKKGAGVVAAGGGKRLCPL